MAHATSSKAETSWKQQPDADLNQAAPVQNTWYTILNTTPKVNLQAISFQVLVANEDIEVRVTIDGLAYVAQRAPATFGTRYWVYLVGAVAVALYLGTDTNTYNAAHLANWEGRSVKVEIRKITANGAGNLQAKVTWQQR
jgi:hypothetical protein